MFGINTKIFTRKMTSLWGIGNLFLLAACATQQPANAPLTSAELNNLAIEHIYISLDDPVFEQLQSNNITLGSHKIDEAQIVTKLKESFDTELKAATKDQTRGTHITTLDVRVTKIIDNGPPYAMQATAFLIGAEDDRLISTYKLSATYGKGGSFEKFGQGIAGAFGNSDILGKLSLEMANSLRNHMYPR